MESFKSSPCTNAHSTSAKSARFHTSAACKTALRLWNQKATRLLRRCARAANCKSQAMAKPPARSTDTSLWTGSACAAAPWLSSFAVVAHTPSAHPAITMPWPKDTISHRPAKVALTALLESHSTPRLQPKRLPASLWAAASADQKTSNSSKLIMIQVPS